MSTKTGVLLLHGLTGVPSEMRPVEKHLQKLGYETEAATLAGHGVSQDEMLNSTAKDWIDSAEKAMERLLEKTDSVVVCGLSMGASIAGVLAARHPERVSALIMLSPTLNYDLATSQDKGFDFRGCHQFVRDAMHNLIYVMPWLGKLLYWTESPPYGLKDERLQRQITKAIEAAKRGEETKFGLFRTYWVSLMEMNHVSREFLNRAPEVHCPVLLVSSLEDSLVSLSNGTNSYERLASRHKSLAVLTGCDHVMTLDLKRNYVSKLVGEFMEAVTDQESTVAPPECESQLTFEIHNRLNPLSNLDWARLVPGSQSLEEFGLLLQRSNVHESQCHTIVVRWNNQPLLMVPLVVLQRQLNVQMGSGAQLLAGILGTFNPAILRPRVALLGISENAWGLMPPSGGDPALIAQAWKTLEKICRDLAGSYKCSVTAFIHSEFQTMTASRKHRVTDASLSAWLAERSILETPGSRPTTSKVESH